MTLKKDTTPAHESADEMPLFAVEEDIDIKEEPSAMSQDEIDELREIGLSDDEIAELAGFQSFADIEIINDNLEESDISASEESTVVIGKSQINDTFTSDSYVDTEGQILEPNHMLSGETINLDSNQSVQQDNEALQSNRPSIDDINIPERELKEWRKLGLTDNEIIDMIGSLPPEDNINFSSVLAVEKEENKKEIVESQQAEIVAESAETDSEKTDATQDKNVAASTELEIVNDEENIFASASSEIAELKEMGLSDTEICEILGVESLEADSPDAVGSDAVGSDNVSEDTANNNIQNESSEDASAKETGSVTTEMVQPVVDSATETEEANTKEVSDEQSLTKINPLFEDIVGSSTNTNVVSTYGAVDDTVSNENVDAESNKTSVEDSSAVQAQTEPPEIETSEVETSEIDTSEIDELKAIGLSDDEICELLGVEKLDDTQSTAEAKQKDISMNEEHPQLAESDESLAETDCVEETLKEQQNAEVESVAENMVADNNFANIDANHASADVQATSETGSSTEVAEAGDVEKSEVDELKAMGLSDTEICEILGVASNTQPLNDADSLQANSDKQNMADSQYPADAVPALIKDADSSEIDELKAMGLSDTEICEILAIESLDDIENNDVAHDESVSQAATIDNTSKEDLLDVENDIDEESTTSDEGITVDETVANMADDESVAETDEKLSEVDELKAMGLSEEEICELLGVDSLSDNEIVAEEVTKSDIEETAQTNLEAEQENIESVSAIVDANVSENDSADTDAEVAVCTGDEQQEEATAEIIAEAVADISIQDEIAELRNLGLSDAEICEAFDVDDLAELNDDANAQSASLDPVVASETEEIKQVVTDTADNQEEILVAEPQPLVQQTLDMQNELLVAAPVSSEASFSGVDTAVARLLAYDTDKYLTLPTKSMVELLESPKLIILPGSEIFVYGMLQWQNTHIPVIDLPLLINSQVMNPQANMVSISFVDVVEYAMVIAYQDGKVTKHVAIRLNHTPKTTVVADSMATELPVGDNIDWSPAISCFAYNNQPVPILDPDLLFK